MIDAEETKRVKARKLRYRKPIVRNLNIDTIKEEIWDIQEECENVHWYFDTDEDTKEAWREKNEIISNMGKHEKTLL